MSKIHFLNVYEGDCNIIQHDSGRTSVIDVSNADDHVDTLAERLMKASAARALIRERNYVPSDKKNYRQKHAADNPIDYLKKLRVSDIFRFIVTHPDMDHLDGIRDLFGSFSVSNVWDTDNRKPDVGSGGGYNGEDWQFYRSIRDGRNTDVTRLTLFSGSSADFYAQDDLHILAPTQRLVSYANQYGDYNDCSYVLLYAPPKAGGGHWKFLFAGDSHDRTWDHILSDPTLRAMASNVDVLFAPHHGRDSNRNYDFLNVVKPKLTLFGNASSEHLAYSCYPEMRLTNNQAGYIILDIRPDHFIVFVKNEQFAIDFTAKRGWLRPFRNVDLDAYPIVRWNAR